MEALKMNAEKILFIQTAFIGDAILILPAIQKLKEKFSSSKIDVICIPESKEIFESSAYIDNVFVLDKKGNHKSLISTLKFVNELKKNNYSKLYSAHRSMRTAIMVLSLGVKESYGFNISSLMHVYKNLINYDSTKHEVQRNLELVGCNYIDENWKIKPEISVSISAKQKISEYLNQNKIKNDFIAIAPGSIWETKKYPQTYYEEIIKYLVEKKFQIVLIGGIIDKDLCSSLINENFFEVFDSSGLFSVVESIELLTHSKLLISNDSAPTHMGMCADIKVLTIYCSTVPQFGFYPYNSKSRFISYDDLNCKPCGIHGHNKCPINTFECAEKLKPNIIIKTLEEMLND